MDRKIKYRAWDTRLNRYVNREPVWIDDNGNTWLDRDPKGADMSGCIKIYKDDHLIIEQYTGLKDKNGKEIFEGDVIADSEMSYIVKYGEYDDSLLDDKAFGWYTENIEDDVYKSMNFVLYANTGQVEVIGNIHENPK